MANVWRKDASSADGFNGPTAGLISSLACSYPLGTASADNFLYCWVWRGYDEIDDTEDWTVTDTYSNEWRLIATSGEPTFAASGASGSRQALYVCHTGMLGGNPHTVTVTFPNPSHYGRMIIAEYGLSFGAAPMRVTDIALNTARFSHTNAANGVVMPSVMARNNDFVVACVQSIDGACTYAAGTGFGHLEGNTNAGAQAAEDQQMGSDGQVTPTFTASASDNSFGMSFVIRELTDLTYTGPFNPPVRGEEYAVAVPLRNVHGELYPDAQIAVGDVKVDLDGSGLYGIEWPPQYDENGLMVRLSPFEMDADVVTVVGIDQSSPKRWADFVLAIPTVGA